MGLQWMMVDVANFSGQPTHLGAGTPLGEAKELDGDWLCVVVDVVDYDGASPYGAVMSWELTSATTDEQIEEMV